MASTRGRSEVIPVTNKSGGSLAAGDVVVVDTTNDTAVTTTTTGRAEVSVGVAQETIANNATGKVLISGYAALINVPASVTRGHYIETHTVAKQATGNSSRRTGSFGQFLTGGTTPTGWLWGSTDQTASGGSSLSTGTSFPGSPATGDRFRRSDLGYLIFFYDGTRWVSEQLFTATDNQQNISADTTVFLPLSKDFQCFLETWDVLSYISNTATWVVTLQTFDTENDGLVTLDSVSTASQNIAEFYITTRVLDDVVDSTATHAANVVRGIRVFYDEQSGTASFFGGVNIHYRYIST